MSAAGDAVSEVAACLLLEANGTYSFDGARLESVTKGWDGRDSGVVDAAKFMDLWAFAIHLADDKRSPLAAADLLVQLRALLPSVERVLQSRPVGSEARQHAFSRFVATRRDPTTPQGDGIPAGRFVSAQRRRISR